MSTDLKEELSGKKKIRDELLKLQQKVSRGFNDEDRRQGEIRDYWDIYNCNLTTRQAYSGKTKAFAPIVREAVDARCTRFANQLFPSNGRYVEVVSESGDIPYAHIALLEHYVRKLKLRTEIVPAMIVNGDIEGQYSVYVSEKKTKRFLTHKVKRGLKVSGIEIEGVDEHEDIEEETVTEWCPDVEVLHDQDLLILPQTAESVDDAIESGGCVTVLRRFSKAQLNAMAEEGLLEKKNVEELKAVMSKVEGKGDNDVLTKLAKNAGVKLEKGKSYAEVYETWKKLELPEGYRICVTWFGGTKKILGCKRNPYWCDRVPVISAPVDKFAGVFKGVSTVKACASLQYAANDALNEAMDSSRRSLLPITMTNPEKNPRIATMIMDDGAIWATSPQDTQFVTFPQLWGPAAEIIANLKNEIFQILSVNPSMIPGQTGGKSKKMSQAEIANEQQIDVLTTNDAVVTIEESIMNEILERLFEYDMQFRDEDITVRKYGELGLKVATEVIKPIQYGDRYMFRWNGTDMMRTERAIQQQISAINVIRGIPPEMYKGHTLDMTPAIENLMENAFGPRLGPRIFKSQEDDNSVPATIENQLMEEGFKVPIHATDNDQDHIQKHLAGMASAENKQAFQTHIQQHQQQMEHKEQLRFMQAMQQQQAAAQKGTPGAPGGAGPGVPGQPAPGSQPAGPRNLRQPPGALRPDEMAQGGGMMPPKM